MKLNVYDVGHGSTVFFRDEVSGRNALLDCGYNENTGFHPVDEVIRSYGAVTDFFMMNYDRDHVDGIPHWLGVAGQHPMNLLYRNKTLTSGQLLSLKTPPHAECIIAMAAMIDRYSGALQPGVLDNGELKVVSYYNPYPTFSTTNDLSMVVFVHHAAGSFVIPGDLEVGGWQALLQLPNFRADLGKVTVFVASHHGRRNGYCEDVFDFCSPTLFVISDDDIKYETQDHCYDDHATGCTLNGQTRKVLTTRSDGHIRFWTDAGRLKVDCDNW